MKDLMPHCAATFVFDIHQRIRFDQRDSTVAYVMLSQQKIRFVSNVSTGSSTPVPSLIVIHGLCESRACRVYLVT